MTSKTLAAAMLVALSTCLQIQVDMKESAALPELKGNPNTITFSGFSAGCQFSQTMQVIHSATIKGANLMECGPYSTDLKDFRPNTKEVLMQAAIDEFEKNVGNGDVDSKDSFSKVVARMVSGTNDGAVPVKAVEAMSEFYDKYGVKNKAYEEKDCKHDVECCKPIEGLKKIYTELGYEPEGGFQDPSEELDEWGDLSTWDQQEFLPEGWKWEDSSFRDDGYLYVPKSCKTKICNVHFVMHGCGAQARMFSENLGFNEFAATNDIIMVYPDARCWGYSGDIVDEKAYTKDGMMSKAVMSMIKRVTGSDGPEPEKPVDSEKSESEKPEKSESEKPEKSESEKSEKSENENAEERQWKDSWKSYREEKCTEAQTMKECFKEWATEWKAKMKKDSS